MHRLCSSSDVQLLTKLNEGDNLTEPQLQLLDDLIIPAVGALCAGRCGRPDFDKKLRTEYLSPPKPRQVLFVASPPISPAVISVPAEPTDIAAIQVWQSGALPRVYGTDELLVEGTDFAIDEEMGMIAKLGTSYFADGYKAIKVTYTGGYLTGDSTGVPDDLKMAAAMQSKVLFDRREEFGITGRSLEGGSMNYNTLTLPTQITMILDRYRIMNV